MKGVLWGNAQRNWAPGDGWGVGGGKGRRPWVLLLCEMRLEAPIGTEKLGRKRHTLHTEETSLLLGGQNPSFKGKVSLNSSRTRNVQEIYSASCHRDTSNIRASLWLFLTPLWFLSWFCSHGPWFSLTRHEKGSWQEVWYPKVRFQHRLTSGGKRLGCQEVEEWSAITIFREDGRDATDNGGKREPLLKIPLMCQ